MFSKILIGSFEILEKHGYDQLRSGSVEYFEENLELQWVGMLNQGADTVKAVREWYETNQEQEKGICDASEGR